MRKSPSRQKVSEDERLFYHHSLNNTLSFVREVLFKFDKKVSALIFLTFYHLIKEIKGRLNISFFYIKMDIFPINLRTISDVTEKIVLSSLNFRIYLNLDNIKWSSICLYIYHTSLRENMVEPRRPLF